MNVFLFLGNALLVTTAVLSLAFCVLYQLWAPWQHSDMGRNVMIKSLAITAVTGLGALRLAFGAALDTTWFLALRLAVFAVIPLAIAWRILILIRIQYGKHRD